MDVMHRRKFVFAALCGAAAGLALAPFGAEALTLDAGAAGRITDPLHEDIQRVQVVVTRPRRRRWICSRRRGRRVCGWRWV